MKKTWDEKIEKWLIRLAIIQCLVLVIGQVLMSHTAWTPYLNQAVQDEGVLKYKNSNTVQTMEQTPAVWYDKTSKTKGK